MAPETPHSGIKMWLFSKKSARRSCSDSPNSRMKYILCDVEDAAGRQDHESEGNFVRHQP